MEQAYVTVLSHGDRYAPGVVALGRSLERSGTSRPRLVLVTPDVPRPARDRLSGERWLVREVPPIENPNPRAQPLFARFAKTFTKLRAFSLSDVEKVVLLDADTIVMQNVDELFQRPSLAAAPDYIRPDRFNSGVLVLEPSTATFARMMEALAVSENYDGGDQGFLNAFYPDWYECPAAHRLPAAYNMHHYIYQFLRAFPQVEPELEREAKILHYSVQKPWRSRATLTGGSEAWWTTYYGALPVRGKRLRRRLHGLEDRLFNGVLRTLLAPPSRPRA